MTMIESRTSRRGIVQEIFPKATIMPHFFVASPQRLQVRCLAAHTAGPMPLACAL